MMQQLKLASLVFALLVFIAACGAPSAPAEPPPDEHTQADVEEAFADYNAATAQVSGAVMQDAGVNAMLMMPEFEGLGMIAPMSLMTLGSGAELGAQALEALSADELPRGVYEFDENQFQWVEIGASANLVLQWEAQDFDTGATYQAELTIDWGTTIDVSTRTGTAEVPTDDMNVSLMVDGSAAADLDLAFSWYAAPACNGPIDEPDSFSLNGYVGTDATIEFDDVGFAVTSNSMGTSGEVTLADGADSASFHWDVSATGNVIRDSDCYLDDFEVDTGSVTFGTSATSAGVSTSFEFNLDFDNLVFDPSTGELESVDINGNIQIDGSTAVTFNGTLDDLDSEPPGANVTLTFADGTSTTLKAFLEGSVAAPAALEVLALIK